VNNIDKTHEAYEVVTVVEVLVDRGHFRLEAVRVLNGPTHKYMVHYYREAEIWIDDKGTVNARSVPGATRYSLWVRDVSQPSAYDDRSAEDAIDYAIHWLTQ